MGDIIRKAVHHNVWFWVLLVTAILLIVASWIVPPMAVIDGSVLGAVGELAGFGALGALVKAMDMGVDARVRHHDTEVTVGDLNKSDRRRRYYEDVPDMEGEEDE
jgi:hypothetical protein